MTSHLSPGPSLNSLTPEEQAQVAMVEVEIVPYKAMTYERLRAAALTGDRMAAAEAFARAWESWMAGLQPASGLAPKEEPYLLYYAMEGPLVIDGPIEATRDDCELLASDLVYEGGLFNSLIEARDVRDKLIAEGHLRKFEGVKGSLPAIFASVPFHAPLPADPIIPIIPAGPSALPAAAIKLEQHPVKGKVIHVEISGWFWGIISNDGKRFDVDSSLPEKFKKDGLEIEAELETGDQSPGLRMWGQEATVVSIKKAPLASGGGALPIIGLGAAAIALVLGARYVMKK